MNDSDNVNAQLDALIKQDRTERTEAIRKNHDMREQLLAKLSELGNDVDVGVNSSTVQTNVLSDVRTLIRPKRLLSGSAREFMPEGIYLPNALESFNEQPYLEFFGQFKEVPSVMVVVLSTVDMGLVHIPAAFENFNADSVMHTVNLEFELFNRSQISHVALTYDQVENALSVTLTSTV